MSKPYGNTLGLKPIHIQRLEKIYRRKIPIEEIAHWEILKYISELSHDIRRQVGIVVNRKGAIVSVVVGEHRTIALPPLKEFRAGIGRLSGLRFIHTDLENDGLTQKDLNELGIKRLDVIASVSLTQQGLPHLISVAHVAPGSTSGQMPTTQLAPVQYNDLKTDFDQFILELEAELSQTEKKGADVRVQNRAILCALRGQKDPAFEEDLAETRELGSSIGLQWMETMVQMRDKPDPKFMMGEGKLKEVLLKATSLGVTTLVFQQNLSANQIRHLLELTSLNILDRTQLILTIFAKRAQTHEGKLQVDLAQLKYELPRIREREHQLSRIAGGIGGQGPGETKAEEHRRRAKERINRLEKEINQISENRAKRRSKRTRNNIPVISIVGYTNAGKTTLLNSLTKSEAFTENKPFSTLDPFSKRLRFPREREVVLTDTVGFIRDLPKDLYFAFRATLEEIGEADLLLHVADVSKEDFRERIKVVNKFLEELGFGDTPQLLVLNKADLIGFDAARAIAEPLNATTISAMEKESCRYLLHQIEAKIWRVN